VDFLLWFRAAWFRVRMEGGIRFYQFASAQFLLFYLPKIFRRIFFGNWFGVVPRFSAGFSFGNWFGVVPRFSAGFSLETGLAWFQDFPADFLGIP